jgi:hypothetical protein
LKELKAVRFTVDTFLGQLSGKRVLLWEDNQAVIHILTGLTSRSPALMTELRKLWWLLDVNDIQLRAKYIRSAANVWADRLSRDRDSSDWMFNPRLCREIHHSWSACSVDQFASANNKQLPRFNSYMHDPQSEAVDAMAQSDAAWRAERNWCNPPWHMLGEVAAKLRNSGAPAIVVAPSWHSETWYQQLLALSSRVRSFAPQEDLFFPASQGNRGHVGRPAWAVTVFDVPERPPGTTC